MSRIGIDARLPAYRDGGISTYTRQLVSGLEGLQTEHEFTIVHHRKGKERIGKRFPRLNVWTPPHNRVERLSLSLELLPQHFDVLHSPDFIPPYRGAQHHVITVHDLTFLHFPHYLTADARRYYNAQIDAACRHADHILAVSSATRNDLIGILNVTQDKITVQPHGVNARYRPLPREVSQKVIEDLELPPTYILHVGTLEPRKNIIGLLRAYREILSQLSELPPVVLIGRPGWLFEETWQQIEALQLQDHVIWRQHVTDEQLPAVYNRAAVFISPSHYEGFGMPALEAMACGTVPIVSNRSSLPEVVGDVGLLVEPDNTNSIADALLLALSDTQWLDINRSAAIERAKQFTWERSAKIALDVYTRVS